MNYTQKEFSELFESVLKDSVENGFISKAEDFLDLVNNGEDISNYYVMDKAMIVTLLVNYAYPDMTRIYESAKVIYAEGDDLDAIGDNKGVPRPQATHASAEVTFTLLTSWDEIEGDISIPEGIVLSTEDGIEYVTVEELYLSNGGKTVTVPCLSKNAGQDVKIPEKSLKIIEDNLDYEFSCTNENPSSGGDEAYSDDEYRYLVLNWFKIHVKGSLEAYENYFANFDGLEGYKLVPAWDGSGTMKIILDPGTPYLLNKAYTEIKESVCQGDEIIMMFAPTEKQINIYAQVNVDIDQINPYNEIEKTDIKNRILQAIKIFVDGGEMVDGTYYPGLQLGEDFIPHKLAVFVDDEVPEIKNITFSEPTDYIPILDEEIGVSGDLTVEMI